MHTKHTSVWVELTEFYSEVSQAVYGRRQNRGTAVGGTLPAPNPKNQETPPHYLQWHSSSDLEHLQLWQTVQAIKCPHLGDSWYVYMHKRGMWRRSPWQIKHISLHIWYTATEQGLLNRHGFSTLKHQNVAFTKLI